MPKKDGNINRYAAICSFCFLVNLDFLIIYSYSVKEISVAAES